MTGLETTTEAYILRDLCMRNLPTCISLGVKGPVDAIERVSTTVSRACVQCRARGRLQPELPGHPVQANKCAHVLNRGCNGMARP